MYWVFVIFCAVPIMMLPFLKNYVYIYIIAYDYTESYTHMHMFVGCVVLVMYRSTTKQNIESQHVDKTDLIYDVFKCRQLSN